MPPSPLVPSSSDVDEASWHGATVCAAQLPSHVGERTHAHMRAHMHARAGTFAAAFR
jgi:hypothetical protein